MNTLFYIIFFTLLISLFVWFAVLFLYFSKKIFTKKLSFLVSLSAGALMGGAFLHLLPEASEMIESEISFSAALIAFILFFFMEKIFHWRHCHEKECPVHSFGYINLIGDALHNFIDGLVIAGAFVVDLKLGLATTLAVAFHEIPQEIGDFGVLLYAGFEKKKALILNYLVALFVVFGGVIGYLVSSSLNGVIPYLLSFAAGGFIYIGASDLMPEIRKETNLYRSIISFVVFVAGVGLMFLLRLLG